MSQKWTPKRKAARRNMSGLIVNPLSSLGGSELRNALTLATTATFRTSFCPETNSKRRTFFRGSSCPAPPPCRGPVCLCYIVRSATSSARQTRGRKVHSRLPQQEGWNSYWSGEVRLASSTVAEERNDHTRSVFIWSQAETGGVSRILIYYIGG